MSPRAAAHSPDDRSTEGQFSGVKSLHIKALGTSGKMSSLQDVCAALLQVRFIRLEFVNYKCMKQKT